ncbi:MAG: large conductance mechanosensitive channel protein MscL [Bacilli bacterium]|jgi:large conductance mechanosensitive channel
MKIFKEFKDFISRGNVLQLAVGVIIGGAFSAIISALVAHIFMPLIGLLVNGGLNNFYTVLPNSIEATPAEVFAGTAVLANNHVYYSVLSKLDWGMVINAIINFLLIALILFAIIKIFASIQKAKVAALAKLHKGEKAPEPEPEPAPAPDIVLLTEIRDLLKRDK